MSPFLGMASTALRCQSCGSDFVEIVDDESEAGAPSEYEEHASYCM